MRNLSKAMSKLVGETIRVVNRELDKPLGETFTDIHLETTTEICDRFDLWEEGEGGGGYFPIWLSRVVDGIIRDVDEEREGYNIDNSLKEGDEGYKRLSNR